MPGPRPRCSLEGTTGKPPILDRRLALFLALAPAAAGLAVLGLLLASGADAADCLPVLVALVVVQAGIALVLGVEATRRTRRAPAADRRAAPAADAGGGIALVGNTAEELRLPVGGVLGLLDAVLSAPALPRGARADATAARDAARDIALLLEDLGTLPDGSRAALADAPFRVDEVMESVVTLLSGRAAAGGIRLATAVATGTPPAWRGDAARIRQMLGLLAGVALRVTTHGEIRLEARETAAGALELGVSDTGQGIPADRLSALFEPGAAGGGLAFWLCRDLARRMGGSVAVQSAPGRGTAVVVTLPLAQAAAAEVAPAEATLALPGAIRPRAPAPVPTPVPEAAAGAPVLVVDDVAVNRRLLGTVLERAGFAHEEAEDAEGALARLAARRYAAVLMDVEMPGMDGLEATRRLRASDGPGARLPVIAVTATGSAQGEEAARAAGMDHYLVKPVSAAELAALLGRLGAGRARAEP